MKIEKLICPKCGNTKEFRVDVQSTYVSISLTFNEANEAELNTDFLEEMDIMCPVCAICGWELDYSFSRSDWKRDSAKYTMCHSCKRYVADTDIIIMETCLHKKDYPNCFMWLNGEAELL